jgi:putative phosphoribosyl transferase
VLYRIPEVDMARASGRLPYRDRSHAGIVLAEALGDYAGHERLLVLGLPRGGVIVAAEVARRLGAELDVVVVRKLGVPGQEELAMGAIASGGVMVVNRDVADLVSQETIAQVARREQQELERRESLYRGGRAAADVADRTVLLVDDGLATGATMRAAVESVRERGAGEVVVAVPVAPPHTVAVLKAQADDVICPATPELFFGIGQFYIDFTQTRDDDVKAILGDTWRDRGESAQRL